MVTIVDFGAFLGRRLKSAMALKELIILNKPLIEIYLIIYLLILYIIKLGVTHIFWFVCVLVEKGEGLDL